METRGTLAEAQTTQATDTTALTLIPKLRGTSGRSDFNLANVMGVETPVYHEIQASTYHFSPPFISLQYTINRLSYVHL